MKTWVIVLGSVGLALIVGISVFAGVALANRMVSPVSVTQWVPAPDGSRVHGMRMTSAWAMDAVHQDIHEEMMGILADGLDLSQAEFEDLMKEGKTLAAIAQDQGLTPEALETLFTGAREKAISTAVEEGLISEAMAEGMVEHLEDFGFHGRHLRPGLWGSMGPHSNEHEHSCWGWSH